MCALMGLTAAWAEESAEDLAKAAQNPVANMISIPFQNNINFNAGRRTGPRTFSTSSPSFPSPWAPTGT